MKKFAKAIKNFKWGYLLFAILFAGAGLAFLSFPEDALRGVRIGIGVTAVVFAGIYIALTLANEARGFRFWAKMVLGGVAVVAGGFMIFSSDGAYAYLTAIAGLYLIIDGSFKLQTAILSKRYRSAVWWIMLVLAAGAISLGAVLLRTPFDFTEELAKASNVLGIGLLIDGVQNLLSIGYLYFVEHKTRATLVEDLRAEGSLVTVLDEETDGAPRGKLTRAEKRARREAAREALAETNGGIEAEATFAAPSEPAEAMPAATAETAPDLAREEARAEVDADAEAPAGKDLIK